MTTSDRLAKARRAKWYADQDQKRAAAIKQAARARSAEERADTEAAAQVIDHIISTL